MRFLLLLTVIAVSLSLQGCFTGVESTPRISAGDVRRAVTQPTAEERYFDSVVPEPFARWTDGKEFYVTDRKIRLLFGTTLASDRDLTGSIIRYAGHRGSRSFTGTEVTDLLFTVAGSPTDTLIYRVNVPAKDLMSGRQSVEIPFTIEEAIVDKARTLLLDKKFYIINRNRRNSADEIVPGKRFLEVTVDSVTEGTAVNPIRVTFIDSEGTRSILFIAAGNSTGSPRTFSSMFSFTNPRLRYPSITDETWKIISEGKVREGMTRDECRLSLGTPASVDRVPGYSYLYERWTYDNGIYLIFEDGLLTGFRH